jgi:DNA mismatch repair protein MutS2
MLSKGTQELETLLAGLINEKQKLEALSVALKRERDESTQLNLKLENELQQIEAEERKVIQETRDKVVREAAELHQEIQQAVSALRKERTRERTEQARQALTVVREQLKSEVWQTKPGGKTEGESADEGMVTAGDMVWLKEANLRGTVIAVSEERGQVEVQAGQIKLTLSLDSVEKTTPPHPEAAPESPPVTRQLGKGPVSNELNLRGKRANEIERALDSYLNDAFLANLSEVRIVHGIGTGTVRKIVRDLLASHPLVKFFRPGGRGEGGDGTTVVQL